MTNDPSPISRGPSPSPGRGCSCSPDPNSHQDSTAASLNFRFLPRASLSSLHPATDRGTTTSDTGPDSGRGRVAPLRHGGGTKSGGALGSLVGKYKFYFVS